MNDRLEMQDDLAGRVRNCSSCNAPIVWLLTRKGKRMPVNAETVSANDQEFNHKVHISHFATCPYAEDHRKQKHTHDCKWPRCDVQVSLNLWGCKRHWFKLPVTIRRNISAAWRVRNYEVHRKYCDAAQDWIRETNKR